MIDYQLLKSFYCQKHPTYQLSDLFLKPHLIEIQSSSVKMISMVFQILLQNQILTYSHVHQTPRFTVKKAHF